MKIKKEILYRFFRGTANSEENKKVREYLETSTENWKEYLYERKLFDAVLLNGGFELENKLQKRRMLFHLFMKESIKIAAILVFAIGISYLWLQSADSSETKTVINTLHGQMANVTLPDGTKVWLNSDTRLEFPNTFAKDKREINIDGEAYFEVAHNAKKPFVVHTAKEETVEVLGTKFYVEAYSKTEDFETSLIEGSVRVNAGKSSLVISPFQRAILKNGKIEVEEITNLDVYRWREGLICFKNEHFADILKGLEKYYGVKIEISDKDIKNPQLTVKFRLSDGIDYALRVLQKKSDFFFTRDDERNVFVIRK